VTAAISELFSSIQGEGLLVGERQVFVRFTGCNLDCAYCDTPAARTDAPTCRIERTPGRQDFEQARNPLTARQVADAVKPLVRPQPGLHHSVALTGGEPLLHADFLLELLPLVGDLGLGAYLETNGTLADELVRVLPHIDVVCLDIKLPSATKQAPIWGMHERFLLALAASEDHGLPRAFTPSAVEGGSRGRLDPFDGLRASFAKAVITADCEPGEVETAARLIRGIDAEMPLVLQPVTPAVVGRERVSRPPAIRAPSPRELLDLQAIAKQHLPNVRIIPQMHKLAGFL
jgi:organic radical activating enzyme